MDYIILALAGLLPATWLLYRRRDPTLAATYFLAAAFVHTADWVASGALGLYKYRPGLFADPIIDDATGVVLAELIFVGTFAVLLVTLIRSWVGALVGAALVTLLEIYFEQVGGLEYHGWLLWYTSVAFVPYFLLVRQYRLAVLRHGLGGGWLRVLHLLALAKFFNGLAEIVFWAGHAVRFTVSLVPGESQNQALLRFIFHICTGAPLAYWTLRGKGPFPWPRILTAGAAIVVLSYLAAWAGFRQYQPPWNPWLQGLVQSISFLVACWVSYLIDHSLGVAKGATGKHRSR